MSASKPRGKNWGIEEDEALCMAWINTSQDAAKGMYQRIENLYDRIYENFIEICTERNVASNPELRGPSGIKARWHQVSKLVSKFAGCMAQIHGRQQSGASPEDVVKQPLTLFTVSQNGPFTLMHCYRILESAPKWRQYLATKVNATKRKRSESQDVDHQVNTDDDEFTELTCQDSDLASQGPSSSSSGGYRPRGQKSTKIQQKQTNTMAAAGFELAKSGKLLARVANQKLQSSMQRTLVLNRLVNNSVMSVDVNSLGEAAKQYYEIEQQRILAETKATSTGYFEPVDLPSCQQENSESENSEHYSDVEQLFED